MPALKAIIGSNQFIGSGNILIPMNEKAQIFPFDDNLYSFYLSYAIDDSVDGNGGWTSNTKLSPMEIVIKRPWFLGGNVLSYGISIAQDELDLVLMAINSSPYGEIDNYQIFASYTIYKRRK